jgi:hypothetical protein
VIGTRPRIFYLECRGLGGQRVVQLAGVGVQCCSLVFGRHLGRDALATIASSHGSDPHPKASAERVDHLALPWIQLAESGVGREQPRALCLGISDVAGFVAIHAIQHIRLLLLADTNQIHSLLCHL